MGRLVEGLVPAIQKGRPDMMPKLAKMTQPMTDILKETTGACRPLMDLERNSEC